MRPSSFLGGLIGLILSGSVASAAFAQRAPKGEKGWIVTNAGDTVRGTIRLGTPTSNAARIQFTPDTGQVGTTTLIPYQIKAWKTDSGRGVYVAKGYRPSPKSTDAVGVFMLRMSAGVGDVQCYEYFNAEMGTAGMTQYFVEKGGKLILIDQSKFYKQLTEIFADSPEIVKALGEKQYKKKELLRVVEDYNAWFEKQWQ